MRRVIHVVAVSLCFTVIPILGDGTAHAAGLLIADGGLGGVLEIEEHIVDVTINNGISVTTVEQTFRNTENRIVEALYSFPVPKGASVAGFSMWIHGKEMIGEVVEKQRAREIYESYKVTRRDPGLLEQVDYKTFEMRIFPIPAGAQQRVKIRYYQQLDFDHDWATYVYPLQTKTRQNMDQRTMGRFAMRMRVLSEVPMVDLSSPSHFEEFVVASHTPHFFEASLEKTGGSLAEDVVLSYQATRPKTGCDLITSQPKGEDGYFMLTLTAGEELESMDTPMDYVFVLDISGSMAHAGKLGFSRKSIEAFVEKLSPTDRFELVAFNLMPQAIFNELRPATADSIDEATRFLRSQQARGGTALRHAVQTAYKYGDPDRPLNVVILSDGMADPGERDALMSLIKARPSNATVFAIGVGNEVNRPLLTQLTEEAGGLAAFISHGDDFERQASAFRRKLLRPAATNVQIDFKGMDVYDVVPAKIPNLFHGAPVHVFGRYRHAKDPQVRVTGDILGRSAANLFSLDLGDGKNPEVERMWAFRRIESLMRSDANREAATKNEIVALAEAYSIVTPYTSFIVLENDDEYRRWRIDRRNLQRMRGDRKAQAELEERFERMRNESLAGLGPNAPTRPVSTPARPAFMPSASNSITTPEPSSGLLTLLAAGWLLSLVRRRR